MRQAARHSQRCGLSGAILGSPRSGGSCAARPCAYCTRTELPACCQPAHSGAGVPGCTQHSASVCAQASQFLRCRTVQLNAVFAACCAAAMQRRTLHESARGLHGLGGPSHERQESTAPLLCGSLPRRGTKGVTVSACAHPEALQRGALAAVAHLRGMLVLRVVLRDGQQQPVDLRHAEQHDSGKCSGNAHAASGCAQKVSMYDTAGPEDYRR